MAITFTKPETVSVASAGVPVSPPVGGTGDPAARARAGGLLVDLYRYLETWAPDHPILLPAIVALRDAVAEYRSASVETVFAAIRGVVEAINGARAVDRVLPEP